MRLSRRCGVLLTAGLLHACLFGCGTHKTYQTASEQLLQASKDAGIEIRADEMLSISRGDESFVTAPIAGWERIAPTELRGGVNIAFAYFDTHVANIPKGYYTLKAFANVTGVNTVPGTVQLIDQQHHVVAEIPAEAMVHSLTVPDGASSRRTYVTITRDGTARKIWYRCSNGSCILMHVLSDDPW